MKLLISLMVWMCRLTFEMLRMTVVLMLVVTAWMTQAMGRGTAAGVKASARGTKLGYRYGKVAAWETQRAGRKAWQDPRLQAAIERVKKQVKSHL